MYRALYRKWRPQRFEDVVGQRAIVTALKNQITAGRVGHAYLFTGVRGTGKTTCAKIFAKAVNCLHPVNGDPCGECEICKGIDNGSLLDVVEMDAASNNGVDDIRDLRDETAYTPSACQYKVYIIDEVHMLSTAAFNALLKTLEEPPAHVIFILATTEIQKVPATILSRCQRYDFTRIGPEDIARRVEYIAGEEKLELTSDGAELIAHYRALMLAALPGGQALLSGVSPEEEALYLQKGPEMGQREAIRAIRTLGTALEHMTRGSDQRIELELALFSLSEPPQQMQAVTVQAAPARAAQPEAPRPFAAAVQPFASASVQPAPAATAPQTPAAGTEPAPAVQQTPPQPAAQEAPPAPADELPPMPEEPPVQQSDAALPWDEPAPQAPPPEEPEPVSQPEKPAPAEPAQSAPAAEEPPAPVQEHPADPVLTKPRSVAQQGTNPFPYWGQIVQKLEGIDPMLYMYLRKSKAYFDGTRVLIDGGKTFRDFIRVNKDSQKLIKKLIAEVSGVPVPIGPYEPKTAGKTASNAEQSLLALEKLGLEVSIEDTARKKR